MTKQIFKVLALTTLGVVLLGGFQSTMLADTKPASTPVNTPAIQIPAATTVAKTAISKWMSWEGGVDFSGSTVEGATTPNVIIHLARMVHTPVGSAPSGIVMYQPNPKKPPVFMGFVSTNKTVGKYFAKNIFTDTPFATAPTIVASSISIDSSKSKDKVSSKIRIPGYLIETELSGIESLEKIDRAAGSPMPFAQQGLEAAATKVALKINGKSVKVYLMPQVAGENPSTVWSPTGVYAR